MSEDEITLTDNTDLSKIDEETLSSIIASKRNLPYTLKVERVEGKKVTCRNSWGNRIVYILKNGNFDLEK